MKYQEIESIEALHKAIDRSASEPALFFKHSNTCGISSRAFGEYQKYLESPESEEVKNYLIVVQNARAVSNELARVVSVEHESPQAILVRNGLAVWNDSHMNLKRDVLIKAVKT